MKKLFSVFLALTLVLCLLPLQAHAVIVDGAQAPDKQTLKVIAAIDAIPEEVTYEQRDLVETARAMYNEIATLEQQALVSNYDKLLAAEARIRALAPQKATEEDTSSGVAVMWYFVFVLILLGSGAGFLLTRKKKQNTPPEDTSSHQNSLAQ